MTFLNLAGDGKLQWLGKAATRRSARRPDAAAKATSTPASAAKDPAGAPQGDVSAEPEAVGQAQSAADDGMTGDGRGDPDDDAGQAGHQQEGGSAGDTSDSPAEDDLRDAGEDRVDDLGDGELGGDDGDSGLSEDPQAHLSAPSQLMAAVVRSPLSMPGMRDDLAAARAELTEPQVTGGDALSDAPASSPAAHSAIAPPLRLAGEADAEPGPVTEPADPVAAARLAELKWKAHVASRALRDFYNLPASATKPRSTARI